MQVARQWIGSSSGTTRGLWFGGFSPIVDTIDYVTIANTGSATDFGNLSSTRYGVASCASSTRAVVGGGGGYTNIIEYVTISSTGNATDFGDLTQGRELLGACSSSTLGVFAGGYKTGGYYSNTMDKYFKL